MPGYSDTRQLIIDTLMGRPAGTEIQPEDHQAFALALNDYIRSVELVAGSGVPVAFAEPDTVPVQPNDGQAVYLSQVSRGTTVTFLHFIDQNGNAISVTSDSNSVTFVTLLWNGQYWSSQIATISGVSDDTPIVKGDAENSAVLKGEYDGYSNKAISQTSVAIGAATTAGLKGWYYSAIDFTNKKITLSDRPTYILAGSTLLNGGWLSGTPNIEVDDVISLVNDSKYDLCSKVIAINGNVITVDSLPFTELKVDLGASAAVIAGQFSDGYSVYIPDRPDAGIIDFGGGAFSEGGQSKASNICSHAEGLQTHAYGQYSHTEGRETKAGYAAHAEGRGSEASGEYSHAEGYYAKSKGIRSHAEGDNTSTEARAAHAEGSQTQASGASSHAEGATSIASGTNSHAEGTNTNATKEAAHSEGARTRANGTYSHAEGSQTRTIGTSSHAEGESTVAEGNESHAEGYATKSIGLRSHAEGDSTSAEAQGAHSEGARTHAYGVGAHSEGVDSSCSGRASHVEGERNEARGNRSHAEGYYTITENNGEHACGTYNNSTQSSDAAKATRFSIGIGTSSTDRKNAVEVKQNGDVYIIGIGGYNGKNSDSAQTLQEILANL